jgi:hypothetical protein
MQEEMHMSVDQAGEQRGVAEVDDPGALRMVNGDAYGANAIALDQNFAWLEQGAGVHLEQAGGVEDDGCGGWLLGGGGKGQTQTYAESKAAEALKKFQHGTNIAIAGLLLISSFRP